MTTTTVRKDVGKKRTGPDRGPITTTKVYADLLQKARMIANHKSITLFDLVDDYLLVAVQRDHAKMVRELSGEEKGGK